MQEHLCRLLQIEDDVRKAVANEVLLMALGVVMTATIMERDQALTPCAALRAFGFDVVLRRVPLVPVQVDALMAVTRSPSRSPT